MGFWKHYLIMQMILKIKNKLSFFVISSTILISICCVRNSSPHQTIQLQKKYPIEKLEYILKESADEYNINKFYLEDPFITDTSKEVEIFYVLFSKTEKSQYLSINPSQYIYRQYDDLKSLGYSYINKYLFIYIGEDFSNLFTSGTISHKTFETTYESPKKLYRSLYPESIEDDSPHEKIFELRDNGIIYFYGFTAN